MARSRPQLFLRPFRVGDDARFVARPDFAREKAAVGWDWSCGPPRGRAWTLLRDYGRHSEVRGVGGLYSLGAGYWEGWAILADLEPREWIAAGHLAAQVLDGFETFNAPTAISATARTDLRGAQRLLEKLHFTPQGFVTDGRVGADVAYRYMVRAA